MSQDQSRIAVLFAVVCESARLYEALGDDRAHRRIAQCADAMATAVAAHKGRVVKTADAELLAVLPDADSAYQAASDIMEAQRSDTLSVRVGFNIGPVIEDAGDVFGDTVNLAARVAALAWPGEALMTDEAACSLSVQNRGGTRLLNRETTVKGKSAPITVHEIAIPDEDMTVMAGLGADRPRGDTLLGLDYGGRRLTVAGETGKITIGRVDDNDLVVPDTAVSRHHATIVGSRGSFYISDLSTNGTYVQTDGRAPLLLKRDKLQLTGTGSISLGRTPGGNAEHLIWFEQLPA